MAIVGTRGYPSYYGGFETLVRRLAPYLVRNGWDVTVYSRHGQTVESEADADVRVKYSWGIDSTSLSTLSYGMTASAAAVWEKPDVALVMNVANGYFLPALRARGVPVALNVDGLEWIRDKWSPLARRVFRVGAQLSAQFANTLIADSTNIADYWMKELNRSSLFVPYGGECSAQMVDGAPAAQLGLAPGEFVLAVARLVPENSIDVFLDAARMLPDDTHIVLVGSAPDENPLMRAARDLEASRPNVHLLGHIRNDNYLNWLWSNAGVYFHGHSVGGTNPALVQAMACGATVLARDTVFNREVLAETGLFSPPEAATVATTMMRMLGDRAEQARLAKLASERAADAYSWQSVLQGYEEALRSLLPGGTAVPEGAKFR